MKTQAGLTLIELVIAMSIMIITLSIGVPNLVNFMKNSELINNSNKFASLMSYARSEATKRNSTIRICTSADNQTCAANGRYLIVLNTDNTLLRTTPLSGDITYNFQSFEDASSATITFNTLGSPNDVGQVILCDSRGALHAKGIALNMGGQIRSLVPADITAVSCS